MKWSVEGNRDSGMVWEVDDRADQVIRFLMRNACRQSFAYNAFSGSRLLRYAYAS